MKLLMIKSAVTSPPSIGRIHSHRQFIAIDDDNSGEVRQHLFDNWLCFLRLINDLCVRWLA